MLLKAIYDLRRHGNLIDFDPLITHDFPEGEMRRILRQLEEKGLIDWIVKPVRQLGAGYITAYGTEVVEGDAQAPFTINLNPVIDARVTHSVDKSITISGSTGVQIGDGNVQNIANNIDVEKVIAAIDHSTAGEAEKAEAKGLVRKVVDNGLAITALVAAIRGMLGV
jgi:hypothetical protein